MSRAADDLVSWRELLVGAMFDSEDAGPVVAVAPYEEILDVRFNDGYGTAAGPPFLVWTAQYVYFPVCYDGSEWVGSAPRNPTTHGQSHSGGG